MSRRDTILALIHHNFEILLAAWVHGNHNPASEVLVIRQAGLDGFLYCPGEFWSLQHLRGYLNSLRNYEEVIHHHLVAEGVEVSLPVVILPPSEHPEIDNVLPFPQREMLSEASAS